MPFHTRRPMNRKHLTRKSGLIITLIGIDGSGKSTLASILANYLKNSGWKAKKIYSGNTGIRLGKKYLFYFSLPIDIIENRLLSKHYARARAKHSECKLCKFLLLLSNLLLFLNYIVIHIPKLVLYQKWGYILVADRYVYDYVLSTIVTRTYSTILSRLLVYLTPIPSLIVLLDVTPNVAYLRKSGEKSIEELKLFRSLYLEFFTMIKVVKINAQNGIMDAFLSILRCIESSTSVNATPQLIVQGFDTIKARRTLTR